MTSPKHAMDVAGQVALVTGASGGVGSAIAMTLAENGAKVAVHYHSDEAGAQKTVKALAAESAKAFQADITEPPAAQSLITDVVAEYGCIDILVNNAGIFDLHPPAKLNYAEWQQAWQRTLDTNLLGPAMLSFCAVEEMKKRDGGRIVNITSRGAFRGEPDAPAYGASKAGLNAMSQSLAKAYAGDSIFVFAVAPGFVETDRVAPILNGPDGDDVRNQSPLGRVAKPEEVARTVLFLASKGSEFLTGCIVDVNGASYLRT